MQKQERGQWGSTLGFVLAAAGSAIGLGNIWRFPYKTGENGGAAFVLLYLACVLLVCLPYLFGELILGRFSKKNPVGAIASIRKHSPWQLVGGLGVLTGVFILSYYAVIAGWTFGYIFKGFIAPAMPFETFTASPALVIGLFALFLALTMAVVLGGIEHGIERWSKILMPLLLVLMVLVTIRGLTLPGAGAGLEFFLKPDFSKVTMETVIEALGQAFFSLSLGMGAMVTYGSYLPKDANLRTCGAFVALADTLIAIAAGFMIFPAMFAMGQDPAEGPALLFVVMPKIFAAMPLGGLVAVLFFVLMSVAALTSTVSLLEVVVSYFVDERRWSRRKSVIAIGTFTFLVGLPSAMSSGASDTLTNMEAFGQTGFLAIMDFVWGNVSLAIGGLLLSIFIGWVWGVRNAGVEFRQGSGMSERNVTTWGFFIRWVCPLVIFVVLANLFGVV